jgi:nitrate/nitrite transport system ATP-binding protein
MITNSVEEALLLSDRILPMTPGPRATLGAPVPVELARPRSASELLHDDHAADVRAHVVASLTEDLERSRGAKRSSRLAEATRRRKAETSAVKATLAPEIDG